MLIHQNLERVDLASLKWEIYKSNIGKLETTPVDLSKLNNVLKNEVVKTAVYNELVKNVNTTASSNLVKKSTMTQNLVKLKKNPYHDHSKNILYKNLTSWRQTILQRD